MAVPSDNYSLPIREQYISIENRNFLSPIGFQFTIDRMRGVQFFCQSANIPSMTLGAAPTPTVVNKLQNPGDEIVYEDLFLRFLVDENMKNWYQVANWMREIGTPYSPSEFRYNRGKIKGFTDMSYYEYDIQNIFTWPLDEPPFYEEDGTPIEPLQRYNARLDQTYDLTTNGLGFRGLSKEEDVPLPDIDPDDETYDVEGTVATLEDLPLYAPTGTIYQVTRAEVIYYDNVIPDAPEYSPTLYTNIREINTERLIETEVVEVLTDALYASDGSDESLWNNISEDEN